MNIRCLVCTEADATPYRMVQGVQFFKCDGCASLFADPSFIRQIESGKGANYQHDYWSSEAGAAKERSFGVSLVRVAETFRLCRIPINRFIDIGAGTGGLLDALTVLMPEIASRFWGIEAFPPEERHRSRHPNYLVGTFADIPGTFEAGVCVEVLEHLSPAMVRDLASNLARCATPGSLFYFNSGQPSFVENNDPNYLDPLGRGHIASYSVAGAGHLFNPSGFNVIAVPGRDWAFLVEYGAPREPINTEQLFTRLWNPKGENIELLRSARFGPLMITMGLESSRCFLEHSVAVERTAWALQLERQLRERS